MKDKLELYNECNWDEIICRPASLSNHDTRDINIEAEAYRHKRNYDKANMLIKKSLDINNNNEWTRVIKFKLDLESRGLDFAIHNLYDYLTSHTLQTETLFRLFIDNAIGLCEFDKAKAINSRRNVIRNTGRNKYCVALQCFNKPDVLANVIESLLSCDNKENFDLTVIQDYFSPEDEKKYYDGWRDVKRLISSYHSKLCESFCSFRYISNKTNFGTAPTCKKLLDIVSEEYDAFIFIEDDCILSKDALTVAKFFIENHIGIDRFWFATCESINFNSCKKKISRIERDRVLGEFNDLDDLHLMYGELNFVPSTCFITTKEIWKITSEIRSFTRGPESLNEYVKANNKKTIFPLIPRASDIGMTHELGYSVKNLSLTGIKEQKNNYYLSEYVKSTIEMQSASKELVEKVYCLTTHCYKQN